MKTKLFSEIIIHIIGYKVAYVINSSYYATLINNNMAPDFPHSIPKCNAIGFVYKSDVIGVEVYLKCRLYRVNKKCKFST